jgi:RNA polymerase sigma factor (sigma-70 family)
MTAVAQLPTESAGRFGQKSDQQLVTAVRRGDDRAFETLYERYQRRIHAYVVGMCKDHCRAEDITQEVFVSALRRMRETERPIAFKPWIYEIAKNACIDAFRRSRRAEEISLQADEGFAPADYGRLVNTEAAPDEAVEVKQELDNLRGAFGGLSDTHHQILVLRELEGLSYQQIGERLGMTRPAVESTLFRARRRLTEEYDELASGERCRRVQELFATACKGRLGTRQCRRLARHVAHCQACRRGALAAGVDPSLLVHTPLPKRVAAKVAGLLPFPGFWRARAGDSGIEQLPLLSEQGAGLAKLGVAAVLVAAGVGAGVSTVVPSGPARDASSTPQQSGGAAGGAVTTGTSERFARGRLAGAAVGERAGGDRDRSGARRDARDERPDGSHRAARDERDATSDAAAGAGGGGSTDGDTGATGGGGSAGGGSTGGGPAGGGTDLGGVVNGVTPRVQVPTGPSVELPAVEAPHAVAPSVETVPAPVQEVVDTAGDTVSGATGLQLP